MYTESHWADRRVKERCLMWEITEQRWRTSAAWEMETFKGGWWRHKSHIYSKVGRDRSGKQSCPGRVWGNVNCRLELELTWINGWSYLDVLSQYKELGTEIFWGENEIHKSHTGWLNFINELPTKPPSSQVKEERASWWLKEKGTSLSHHILWRRRKEPNKNGWKYSSAAIRTKGRYGKF